MVRAGSSAARYAAPMQEPMSRATQRRSLAAVFNTESGFLGGAAFMCLLSVAVFWVGTTYYPACPVRSQPTQFGLADTGRGAVGSPFPIDYPLCSDVDSDPRANCVGPTNRAPVVCGPSTRITGPCLPGSTDIRRRDDRGDG